MKELTSLNERLNRHGLGQYVPSNNDVVWASPTTSDAAWPHRQVTTYCASSLT